VGLILRTCANGGVYEAFVRTEACTGLGMECLCRFRMPSKALDGENTLRTKFGTVWFEFLDFRPRMQQFQAQEGEDRRKRLREALGGRRSHRSLGTTSGNWGSSIMRRATHLAGVVGPPTLAGISSIYTIIRVAGYNAKLGSNKFYLHYY
jgi:hypothetical protein